RRVLPSGESSDLYRPDLGRPEAPIGPAFQTSGVSGGPREVEDFVGWEARGHCEKSIWDA
ncbi:MAG: hypothetical protein M3072_17530, partial [Candidatus Dormibacteraeota bacterium]|nr:hypothetical protein [Candidatus Dormibacteraeota bacterium]